mmetsp:Transcript_20921/g.31012  ORF Transcript_20921/g.31012 Transcript_20921/m.31012 type:complete len:83 (-) Transcript_20921:133-381(-)
MMFAFSSQPFARINCPQVGNKISIVTSVYEQITRRNDAHGVQYRGGNYSESAVDSESLGGKQRMESDDGVCFVLPATQSLTY